MTVIETLLIIIGALLLVVGSWVLFCLPIALVLRCAADTLKKANRDSR